MTTQTAIVNLTCDRCGGTILAGSRFALIQQPTKNSFSLPIGKNTTKHLSVHLSHIYKDAQKKLNKKFVQLDIFGGAK